MLLLNIKRWRDDLSALSAHNAISGQEFEINIVQRNELDSHIIISAIHISPNTSGARVLITFKQFSIKTDFMFGSLSSDHCLTNYYPLTSFTPASTLILAFSTHSSIFFSLSYTSSSDRPPRLLFLSSSIKIIFSLLNGTHFKL